ncbi:iron complex transport system substrate-binding protein [Amycolatopsis xylanica]|uniref:Iron complex transport system substrate-binding protein n=1 Tax=Amycolatopsis xylanica TaxID=589385 RepID=A0A1H2W825_9PSEU|nr:ABC transporter substrate-binding protein [Amycolatopsis xylanica]SDW76792.1 iron complex transport system substrate-binding protein [Amycolatopsis xylanica]
MIRARLALPAVLLSLFTLVGCAGRDPAPAPVSSSAPGTPQRIVSLSPATTETLFAIGAGAQVVAVDDQSDFPANAPRTALSGLTPSAEAIAAYKPDLVVASADTGGLVGALGKLGIKALVLPSASTLDEAYGQMTTLGKETGHAPDADRLVTGIKNELTALVAATPKPAAPLSYYHELSQDYYSANSHTFVGQVYGLFGLANVADSAPASGGYPQLSAESLVKADPKLIFLADTKCCKQDAAAVAARPGWAAISAVKNGNVVALDDDIASRWGPRLLDFAKAVAAAVTKAAPGAR